MGQGRGDGDQPVVVGGSAAKPWGRGLTDFVSTGPEPVPGPGTGTGTGHFECEVFSFEFECARFHAPALFICMYKWVGQWLWKRASPTLTGYTAFVGVRR